MRFKPKGVILGLIGGLLGAFLGLGSWALELEENTGLEWLFHQRGAIQPPDEIAIIAIDKHSADQLGLPNESEKWPRQLHAQLVTQLATAGVKSITFDMLFKTPRDPVDDHAFANAVDSANNVILFEFMKKELANGTTTDQTMTIRKRIQPIPPLVDAAAALAPFPLPKVPLKVSQFWRFAPDAGDAPTLPTTTLQLYTLAAYDDFRTLLQQVAPQHLALLPATQQIILQQKVLVPFIHQLKRLFTDHPALMATLTSAAKHPANVFQHSQYLNYYGPPRTITTIPFHQIIQSNSTPEYRSQLAALKGKIIFVGYSAELQWEQKDGFYSVYSRDDGLDISGVEIAATATANLLQDRAVQPLSATTHFATLLLWGLIIGIIAYQLPAIIATLSTLILVAGYSTLGLYQFSNAHLWLPLLIPLLIQAPLILFAGIIWKHLETVRERHNIHQAFSHYLPGQVVEQLSKDSSQLAPGGQLQYGVCLFTDAAQYTRLSEQMSPDALGMLMNRYYAAIFAPIHAHQGSISDVVGDAVMALWPSTKPSAELRNAACHAAIELIYAIEQFNRNNPSHQLPTRIGIHCGEILLGNVGAVGRIEYRATGDVVNTTSRIEGMNKQFGTRLLVSHDVLHDQSDFQQRPLGRFILAGKSRPIQLHELICRIDDATENQRQLCSQFATALALFQQEKWREAHTLFREIASTYNDNASHYYLNICQKFQHTPPAAPWDGTITIETK